MTSLSLYKILKLSKVSPLNVVIDLLTLLLGPDFPVAFEVRPLLIRTFIPMLLFWVIIQHYSRIPLIAENLKVCCFSCLCVFPCLILYFCVIKTVVIPSINASKTSITYASVRDIAKGEDVFSIQNRMFYDELV